MGAAHLPAGLPTQLRDWQSVSTVHPSVRPHGGHAMAGAPLKPPQSVPVSRPFFILSKHVPENTVCRSVGWTATRVRERKDSWSQRRREAQSTAHQHNVRARRPTLTRDSTS